MNNFPKSLFEFSRMFSTEEACWEYLKDIRFPNGVIDERDGKSKPISFVSTRKLWTFDDGYQQSLTSGTIMHKTRTPLQNWFASAYLMATLTPGISAWQLHRQLGMRYETAYMLLMKLRAGLVNPFRTKLRGTVEVDETYIGGKAFGTRGRGAKNKALVIGAVEIIDTSRKQIGGRIRMRQVPTASSENLLKFIQDHVDKNSIIITDGWEGYSRINQIGYKHHIVNELVHIHRAFSNLKTWINGTHHGVSRKHLQAYLNEYTFRYNRRHVPFEAFNSLLGIGTVTESPTYYQLYHANKKYGWKHPNPQIQ